MKKLLHALKIAWLIYQETHLEIVLAEMTEVYHFAEVLGWYTYLTNTSEKIETERKSNDEISVTWKKE